MQMTNILGANYKIQYKYFGDSEINGFTDYTSKTIYIRSDNEDIVEIFWKLQEETIKEQIIEVFAYESGVSLIDAKWVARNFNRIERVYKEVLEEVEGYGET